MAVCLRSPRSCDSGRGRRVVGHGVGAEVTQLVFGSSQANALLAGMRLEFRIWDGLDFECAECGQQRDLRDLHDDGGNLDPDTCNACYQAIYIDGTYDPEQIAELAEL